MPRQNFDKWINFSLGAEAFQLLHIFLKGQLPGLKPHRVEFMALLRRLGPACAQLFFPLHLRKIPVAMKTQQKIQAQMA